MKTSGYLLIHSKVWEYCKKKTENKSAEILSLDISYFFSCFITLGKKMRKFVLLFRNQALGYHFRVQILFFSGGFIFSLFGNVLNGNSLFIGFSKRATYLIFYLYMSSQEVFKVHYNSVSDTICTSTTFWIKECLSQRCLYANEDNF